MMVITMKKMKTIRINNNIRNKNRNYLHQNHLNKKIKNKIIMKMMMKSKKNSSSIIKKVNKKKILMMMSKKIIKEIVINMKIIINMMIKIKMKKRINIKINQEINNNKNQLSKKSLSQIFIMKMMMKLLNFKNQNKKWTKQKFLNYFIIFQEIS